MINMRLLNIHDIIIITAIAVIVHIVAGPLYAKIGVRPSSDDTN